MFMDLLLDVRTLLILRKTPVSSFHPTKSHEMHCLTQGAWSLGVLLLGLLGLYTIATDDALVHISHLPEALAIGIKRAAFSCLTIATYARPLARHCLLVRSRAYLPIDGQPPDIPTTDELTEDAEV